MENMRRAGPFGPHEYMTLSVYRLNKYDYGERELLSGRGEKLI